MLKTLRKREWEPTTDTRFINKNGTSVDIVTVRRRFFESASAANVNPHRANYIWDAAVSGDSYAREVIEGLCSIEIVDSDAGFGFLE